MTLLIVLAAAGCRKPQAAVVISPAPKPPPTISQVDLKSYKPNEAGAVMVVMYHRFLAREADNDLNRKPDTFRGDLETLYKKKYHPVTAQEFVENRMDVPAGKTPVVLTFDDALPSQFKVITGSDGEAHIDPDCAIGIMETFHKGHPDWPTKGTFFILPLEGRNPAPFGQPDSVGDKFNYLIKSGYEIANHTTTHSSMDRLSAEKIQWELATAVKYARSVNAQVPMATLALPYGRRPKKATAKLLESGSFGGTDYKNEAVFEAAWRPVLSPITKGTGKNNEMGYCLFNPFKLERIKPDPRQAKLAGTLEYWLKYFDQNPSLRYVSDGNPEVAAVPAGLKNMVDPERVKRYGMRLQAYSLTAGRAGGAGLSVQ